MSLLDELRNVRDREWACFRENSTGVLKGVEINNDSPIEITGTVGSSVEKTSPTIYNVSAPIANTEVSQVLSSDVKSFTVRVRENANLKVAYVSGESGSNYVQVYSGSSYSEDGLNVGSLTLYFQSPTAGITVEIIEWT